MLFIISVKSRVIDVSVKGEKIEFKQAKKDKIRSYEGSMLYNLTPYHMLLYAARHDRGPCLDQARLFVTNLAL
jgi:fibrillarin-like rRNA methylase